MPHIDLYTVYRLDRRQPSEQLAAALTGQLNSVDPRDTLMRNRIDTARAILGDPARRGRYDQALADPAAPVLDEQALAAIAGRPVPATARSGLAGAFASRQVRILSAITAALALVLVIGVTAVGCSGGSDPSPTAAPNGSGQSSAASTGNSGACTPMRGRAIWLAEWEKDKPRPTGILKLTWQTELPSAVAQDVSTAQSSALVSLVQYQDKSIGVGSTKAYGNGTNRSAAQYDAQGNLVKVRTLTGAAGEDHGPARFDQAETVVGGYYLRVQAGDGVQIPAAANGIETGQEFVLAALPDAFERQTVWVLMRGGTKLYRGTVYDNAGDGGC